MLGLSLRMGKGCGWRTKREFLTAGKTMDVGGQEVLEGLRSKAWETLDGLTIEQLTTLSGVVVGFCGQLVSSS